MNDSHPAHVTADESMQMELREIALARAYLHEGISRLLLASQGNTDAAIEAAGSLISNLLEGVDNIATETRRGNDALRSALETSTGWPIRFYPFPGDRTDQACELFRLGFGKTCPVNITARKAWGTSPGNQWAFTYWRFVSIAQYAAKHEDVDKLITKTPDNRELLKTALQLPVLKKNPATLTLWKKAAWAYFATIYPGKKLATHPDWKTLRVGPSRMRTLIGDGLARMATGE